MVRIAVEGDGAGGVANSGLIDVGGGRVLLTAGGAARALDGAINTSGVIRAARAGATAAGSSSSAAAGARSGLPARSTPRARAAAAR